MSMMRSDPFRDAERLVQHLIGNQTDPERVLAVPIDAYRRGDAFIVELDLPGVESDSIEVTVEKNVVSVQAHRPGPWSEGVEPVVRERVHGTFSRQLFMGENLDTDALSADYNAGVLRLSIPIHPSAKARRIEVATADSPAAVREGS